MYPFRINFNTVLPALFCFLLVAPTPAYADYIDNGLTTIDTSTGLEWLDLTETSGIAYQDVARELKPGGAFEGYKHAKGEEILNLFFGFGLESGPVNKTHLRFLDLFGTTNTKDGNDSLGYAYTDSPAAGVYGLNSAYYRGEERYIVARNNPRHNASMSFEGFGSFLVRSNTSYRPVPEIDASSSALALGFLLLCHLIVRERRHNSSGRET